jgi:uncharacterized protein
LTRNFSRRQHITEYLQDKIYRNTWPAALARRIWRPKFRVWQEHVVIDKPLGSARTLRIAFASDFHSGPLTPVESIESACRAMQQAKADIILLGGDFISISARHAGRLLEPLSSLKAPHGVYAVLGNHDHWAGADAVCDMLTKAQVSVLTNRSVRLPSPFQNTIIAGLDDHLCGYPDADGPEWDPGCATILLLHEPSGLLDLGDRPFDVAICGHTHGGQILMPNGYALVVPHGALSRRYLKGHYSLEGNRHLLVSVGVGNSGLPIRLGPTPEVLICEVASAAQ